MSGATEGLQRHAVTYLRWLCAERCGLCRRLHHMYGKRIALPRVYHACTMCNTFIPCLCIDGIFRTYSCTCGHLHYSAKGYIYSRAMSGRCPCTIWMKLVG
jgi:hypothetical protein